MDSASNHGWQAHLRHNPLGMLGKHLMEAPDFAGAMAGSGILDAVISDPLWKDTNHRQFAKLTKQSGQ